jgi:O-antigen/teichoic acid export membrane protein
MRRHTSTAASSLALLAAAGLLVVLGFSQWQGLGQIMGVAGRTDLSADARLLVVITGAAFAGSFALSWVGSFCSGMQRGYFALIASTAGSLASLLCLFLLARSGGTIAEFALVMGFPPVLATAGLAVYLFTGRHRPLRPDWRLWNRQSFGEIMRLGVPLFLVQLSDLAILSSANVLIANRLGPAEVPRYAVPFALFSVVSRICYFIAAPYWPAYAEASGRNDWIWIRAVAARMLAITAGLMGLGGLVFLITGQAVIGWWAGSAAVPSRSLLAWMTVYFFIGVCSTTTGILVTGLGLARARMYVRVPVGLAHIVGGWLLLPVLGLTAIPLAGGVGFLADFALLTPYALRHIRGREVQFRLSQEA